MHPRQSSLLLRAQYIFFEQCQHRHEEGLMFDQCYADQIRTVSGDDDQVHTQMLSALFDGGLGRSSNRLVGWIPNAKAGSQS